MQTTHSMAMPRPFQSLNLCARDTRLPPWYKVKPLGSRLRLSHQTHHFRREQATIAERRLQERRTQGPCVPIGDQLTTKASLAFYSSSVHWWNGCGGCFDKLKTRGAKDVRQTRPAESAKSRILGYLRAQGASCQVYEELSIRTVGYIA